MKNLLIKIVRGIAVVLLALTTVMTLLGGVGTTCVAWNADKYGKAFEIFVPYMGEYQILVYASVAMGVAASIVTYALVRREKWAYMGALVVLLACLGTAAVQMYYTSTLRQISFFRPAPTNVRFFLAALTLLLFLVLRIPGIWRHADFTLPWRGPGAWAAPAGLSLFVVGLTTLTTPLWAGPSHMLDGYNLTLVLERPLLWGGWAITLLGMGLLAAASWQLSRRRATEGDVAAQAG